VFAGTASFHVGVTVWSPRPELTATLYSLVASGAVDAAGSEYGYETPLVAVVHVELASHTSVGADETVVAELESECEPVVKGVEVAVMFQPAPDPVASPTSNGCVDDSVASWPESVPENVTGPGVLEVKPIEPAASVAVAVVADAATAVRSPPITTAAEAKAAIRNLNMSLPLPFL
jgi:hypothetical protein